MVCGTNAEDARVGVGDKILEVIVANSAGTCFGVEAAIAIAEREKKPILGPLVHNPQIVSDLAASGIPILDRYESLDVLQEKGIDEVIITAHGSPKEVKEELVKRGIRFHDATCPVLLKWVYRKIQRFEGDGYHIVLAGNPQHAEVIATRSYSDRITVVYTEEDVDALPSDLAKTVAICQTTITDEKFQNLIDYIREKRYPDLEVVDTRCKPVKNQQDAVENLAQWVDAIFVVGGFESSNTTNLARIAAKYLPDSSHQIDSPAMIEPSWLKGVRHLGLAAGTSTPKSQIEAVKKRVAELFDGVVHFRDETDDDDPWAMEEEEPAGSR